jgi:putative membrane protein
MRRFGWIVSIPVIIIVALFAVNNRQSVDLELWPLPWAIPAIPVFALTLVAILFGFLFGCLVMWLTGARHRRRLREARRDLDSARSELHVVKQRPVAPTGTAVTLTQTRLPPAA